MLATDNFPSRSPDAETDPPTGFRVGECAVVTGLDRLPRVTRVIDVDAYSLTLTTSPRPGDEHGPLPRITIRRLVGYDRVTPTDDTPMIVDETVPFVVMSEYELKRRMYRNERKVLVLGDRVVFTYTLTEPIPRWRDVEDLPQDARVWLSGDAILAQIAALHYPPETTMRALVTAQHPGRLFTIRRA